MDGLVEVVAFKKTVDENSSCIHFVSKVIQTAAIMINGVFPGRRFKNYNSCVACTSDQVYSRNVIRP